MFEERAPLEEGELVEFQALISNATQLQNTIYKDNLDYISYRNKDIRADQTLRIDKYYDIYLELFDRGAEQQTDKKATNTINLKVATQSTN